MHGVLVNVDIYLEKFSKKKSNKELGNIIKKKKSKLMVQNIFKISP